MKQDPKKETHHEKDVWTNPTTEGLRREECLCLNCRNLNSGTPEHCPTAKAFFEICARDNVALAVTRCPNWGARKRWTLVIGQMGDDYVYSTKDTLEEITNEYEKTLNQILAATSFSYLYILDPSGKRRERP